ncbi:MAG TPA: hypothetical protein VGM02_16505 [Acidobacteriaceae bacterium]|jgi:hypothetical protein
MSLGRWTFVAVGLLLLCCLLLACKSASGESPASAQALPYSSSLRPVIAAAPARIALPQQGRPHLLDYTLYASIATYRTLDYFSTRHALAGGAHETVLPQWVVENRGTFIAFEGLATAGEVGGSVWLIHHGHRRMARAVNVVSIGLGVQAVANNYTEPLSFAR